VRGKGLRRPPAGADTGVVFVGLDQSWEREGVDRQALTLPGTQAALAQALKAVGKPLVLVLIHWGPLALEGGRGPRDGRRRRRRRCTR
jgi:hypothetical protein